MSYSPSETDVQDIADAILKQYDLDTEKAIKGSVEALAHAGMGVLPAAFDLVRHSWANLRQKSQNSFAVPYRTKSLQLASLYTANDADVPRFLVEVADKVVGKLADTVAVPVLSPAVTKLASLAAGAAKKELHKAARWHGHQEPKPCRP